MGSVASHAWAVHRVMRVPTISLSSEVWHRDADDELIHANMLLEEVGRPGNSTVPKGVGMCVGPIYSAAPTFLGADLLSQLALASRLDLAL